MQCHVCGHQYDDHLDTCPICAAQKVVHIHTPEVIIVEKTGRRKPHIMLRLFMKLVSIVLCLILSLSLLGTVLIADIQILTSSGGIKQLITSVLMPNKASHDPRIAAGAGGVLLDMGSFADQLDPEQMEDIMAATGDSNALVDLLYNTMKDMMGEDVPVTIEQVQTFVENSTVTDYIAEKAAGYAEDLLFGTENTVITTDELIQLVEENKVLIEETFDIEISEEQLDEIKSNVITIVEEQDLNNTIRTEINTVIESVTSGSEGSSFSLNQIMDVVRMLSDKTTLYGAIGVCVALVLLLMLANFYNLPGGMTWASLPCMSVGLILAAPIAVVQFVPEALSQLGAFASYANMITVLAPAHYTVFLVGVALFAGSIVWRIVRAAVRKNS